MYFCFWASLCFRRVTDPPPSGLRTRLKQFLAGQRYALRLVVLNAFEGARGGQEDILSSTAAILVQSEVPAVLAMQYDITDSVAVAFARNFYEAIADGLPVDTAVTDARNAVSLANEQSLEWGTPVLYLRAQDGRIFALQSPSKRDPVRPSILKTGRVWQWSVGVIILLLMTIGVFNNWENLERVFGFGAGPTPPPTETAIASRPTETPSSAVAAVPSSTSIATPTNPPMPTATPVPPPNTVTPTATPAPTVPPTPQAGATRVVDDIVYVYVPAGEFRMGSSDYDVDKALEICKQASIDCQRAWFESESPQHPVDVDAFWMMQTEVTNAHYQRCVEASRCIASNNSRWNEGQYAKHPVVNVTWRQANTYAEWVGGRLPTEAEWEKACRGTDTRIYPWGNEAPDENRLNYKSNVGTTTEVGSYLPGAYGLCDMAGNVWEWTSSKYQGYPYDPTDGREDPAGADNRTLRGGSWDLIDGYVRCAYRFDYYPGSISGTNGFRVVVSSPGS